MHAVISTFVVAVDQSDVVAECGKFMSIAFWHVGAGIVGFDVGVEMLVGRDAVASEVPDGSACYVGLGCGFAVFLKIHASHLLCYFIICHHILQLRL